MTLDGISEASWITGWVSLAALVIASLAALYGSNRTRSSILQDIEIYERWSKEGDHLKVLCLRGKIDQEIGRLLSSNLPGMPAFVIVLLVDLVALLVVWIGPDGVENLALAVQIASVAGFFIYWLVLFFTSFDENDFRKHAKGLVEREASELSGSAESALCRYEEREDAIRKAAKAIARGNVELEASCYSMLKEAEGDNWVSEGRGHEGKKKPNGDVSCDEVKNAHD